MDKQTILDHLRNVLDPEHPVSIVDLKIVTEDDITITNGEINIKFKPTSPFCPMGAVIGLVIKKAITDATGKEVNVEVREGTHVREEYVNKIINDKDNYDNTIKKLEQSGLLARCLPEYSVKDPA
jgi:metal-sulfur cluster biosynthetic enzyme